MIKAPLKNKSTELEIQFAIIVPSTNYDKTISNKEFQNRVKGTKKFFSQNFGGSTSQKEVGSYLFDNNTLVDENGVIVETSMTKTQYLNNKEKLNNYIIKKQKDWKQERIMFLWENSAYIYPK